VSGWYEYLRTNAGAAIEHRSRRGRSVRRFRLVSISISVLAPVHLAQQATNLAAGFGPRANGDALIRRYQLRKWLSPALCRDERAAQLVELAVALPLLVVFVVGIFDFSGAFTLKQKLTNIARDAARVAAADPVVDVTNPGSDPISSSVDDAFQVVQQYLTANNINTCGIVAADGIEGPPATWRFSATTSSPACSIEIIINRGYYFPAGSTSQLPPSNCQPPSAPSPNQLQVIATCISIQYAYPWRFGTVSSLLGPTTALPTPLIATAVAMNEN
jgi:hypothetical protein